MLQVAEVQKSHGEVVAAHDVAAAAAAVRTLVKLQYLLRCI